MFWKCTLFSFGDKVDVWLKELKGDENVECGIAFVTFFYLV